MDLAATARIRNGWMKFRELLPFLYNIMTYGSETRSLLVNVGLKFERAEMQMFRWMCGISMRQKDK